MSTAGRPPARAPGDDTADAELGRLLDRRSSLSGPLREAVDADGPAGEVDAAIRAAARRAVAAGPQALPGDDTARAGGSWRARPWWHAARLPLAAAAMLMVTASVTLLVDREQRTLESTTDSPQSSASGSVPASSVLPPGAAAGSEGRAAGPGQGQDGRGLAAERTASQTPGASPTSRPAPAQPPPARSVEPMASAPLSAPAGAPSPSTAAGIARERPAADEESPSMRRSVAPMAARPPPPPPPPAAASDGAAPVASAALPPDRWLQQILELRRSGRTQEAVEALAAFRKAWPGHPLPPELSGTP